MFYATMGTIIVLFTCIMHLHLFCYNLGSKDVQSNIKQECVFIVYIYAKSLDFWNLDVLCGSCIYI